MHFVLDQNFPIQATGLRWPPSIQITPLAAIEPTLTGNHDDWEILLALQRRGDVDGFITNDADMLQLAKEMVVLARSQLVLVVTDGVGHDPIRATGLIMTHLQRIARNATGRSQVYILRPGPLIPASPGTQINRIAQRMGLQPNVLISRQSAEIAKT